MPRLPRIIKANVIYHVLNRGNGKKTIFRKPEDFAAFVKVLSEGLSRYRVDLLCWCLMSNHWHLVLRPRTDAALSEFMRWVSVTHVRRHHVHYGQASGHLYRGRFRSFPVANDSHFLTLCRYLEANPLRAGMVKRAEDWRWSSLHQRTHRTGDLPLATWPLNRPGNWKQLVNEALAEKDLKQVRQSLERDRPLGSDKWMTSIAKRLGLEPKLRERGRPRKVLEDLSLRQKQRRKKEGTTKK